VGLALTGLLFTEHLLAILLSLRLGKLDAIALVGLFAVTLVFPNPDIRIWVAYIYIALAIPLLFYRYRELGRTIRAPFRNTLN
jgi:hypothetical protein